MRFLPHAQDCVIYGAGHYCPEILEDPDQIRLTLLQDLTEHGRDPGWFHDQRMVLNFVPEGQDWPKVKAMTELLINVLRPRSLGLLFNAVPMSGPQHLRWACLPGAMVNHWGFLTDLMSIDIDWANTVLDRKLLCMTRRPSEVRERLVHGILTFLGDQARVSLGSGQDCYTGPRQYLDRCIYIEGVVDDERSHHITDPALRSCLFNVIAESSDQSQGQNIWNSVFLTEKTFKAFALHQIPIWMGVPGVVAQVRALGFDVFDDVMEGHIYDTIASESKRCGLVLDRIQRLHNALTLDECQKLRRDLWPRIQANFATLQQLYAALPGERQRALAYLFGQDT